MLRTPPSNKETVFTGQIESCFNSVNILHLTQTVCKFSFCLCSLRIEPTGQGFWLIFFRCDPIFLDFYQQSDLSKVSKFVIMTTLLID